MRSDELHHLLLLHHPIAHQYLIHHLHRHH
jgi:hypothetical protein